MPDLIPEGCPRVAHFGREKLRVERHLRPEHHRVPDEADDEREQHKPQVGCVDEGEHRPGPYRDTDGTDQKQSWPTVPIAEVSEVWDTDQGADAGGEDDAEDGTLAESESLDPVVQHARDDDERDGIWQDERATGEKNRPPVSLDHADDRRRVGSRRSGLARGTLRLEAAEHRGVFDCAVDVEADPDHDDSAQKRNAPSPRHHLLVREGKRQNEIARQSADESQLRPDLYEAAVEPSTTTRRALSQQQGRAAPLAAESEALQDPQCDQDGRRRPTDGGCGRQEADDERAHSHEKVRRHENGFAAVFVAVVPGDCSAEGTGHEANGEGRE